MSRMEINFCSGEESVYVHRSITLSHIFITCLVSRLPNFVHVTDPYVGIH